MPACAFLLRCRRSCKLLLFRQQLSAAKLLNGCCLRLCLFGAAKVRFVAAPRFLCWKSFFKSPFKVTALLFSTLLTCLFRNNAIYVFLVAALVFLLLFKGCRLRLTAVLAGALAAFLLLKPFNGFLAFGCCIAGAVVLYLKGRFCESCERAH